MFFCLQLGSGYLPKDIVSLKIVYGSDSIVLHSSVEVTLFISFSSSFMTLLSIYFSLEDLSFLLIQSCSSNEVINYTTQLWENTITSRSANNYLCFIKSKFRENCVILSKVVLWAKKDSRRGKAMHTEALSSNLQHHIWTPVHHREP